MTFIVEEEKVMFHHEQGESSGFATGLLAGTLLGASVALLFAPKTGSQLREGIGESVESLRDAIADRYRDLAERAGVEMDNVHEHIDRAAEAFEATARSIVDSIKRETSRSAETAERDS